MPAVKVQTRRLIVGLVLAGLASVGLLWVKYLQPAFAQNQWRGRVRATLRAIEANVPADASTERWECLCTWTLNLHANCGITDFQHQPDWEWMNRFVVELERRAAGPMSVADIDWIWDEYAAHVRGGRKYAENYRPTRRQMCPEK